MCYLEIVMDDLCDCLMMLSANLFVRESSDGCVACILDPCFNIRVMHRMIYGYPYNKILLGLLICCCVVVSGIAG